MAKTEADRRFCRECGKPFVWHHPKQEFCDPGHRIRYWNRRIKGGIKLYEAMVAWRVEYERGGLSELTQVADQLAQVEREIRRKRDARIARHRSPPDALGISEGLERPTEAAAVK